MVTLGRMGETVPEPVTTTLVIAGLGWVGSLAMGVAGNVSDRAICALTSGLKQRVAGLRGVPENHDLARAVRLAQVQALERCIRDYRELGPMMDRRPPAPAIWRCWRRMRC